MQNIPCDVKTNETLESSIFADGIAELCYSKYVNLPKTGKPNEEREWTPLAGIVKVMDWKKDFKCSKDISMEVVALGTGSKCIGKSKMSPLGDTLNDSHAEVMARRGFLRYLYHQILKTYQTGSSEIFKCFFSGKCAVRDNVTFHFFTSHTPCGDASIISKVPGCLDDVGCCLKCNTEKSEIFKKKRNDRLNLSGETVTVTSQSTVCEFGNYTHLPSRTEEHSVEEGEHTCKIHSPEVVTSDKRKLDNEDYFERNSYTKYIKTTLSSGRVKVDSSRQRMELHNSDQLEGNNASDIHRTGAKCLPNQLLQDLHLPGTNYHVVGVLRTKPGRGDPTQSLSCSDKLARWNVVGVQGALTALLINEPIYFQSVIIGGGCPFSELAFKRAIIERLISMRSQEEISSEGNQIRRDLTDVEGLSLPSKYAVHHPLLLQSTLPFKYAQVPEETKRACSSSVVWCSVPERSLEVAVEGKKQGVTKKLSHTSAGRLFICKRELLHQFVSVALSMPDPLLNLPIVLKLNDNTNNLTETKQYLTHLSYKQLKNLSEDYKLAWNNVRALRFPLWTTKCDSLLNFSLADEVINF